MTPVLAELVRRSCLCSDGLCDACTQIFAALEQGERLRASLEEIACIDNNERLDEGEQVQFAMRIAEAALTQVAAMKYRAALHGQEPAADAE